MITTLIMRSKITGSGTKYMYHFCVARKRTAGDKKYNYVRNCFQAVDIVTSKSRECLRFLLKSDP